MPVQPPFCDLGLVLKEGITSDEVERVAAREGVLSYRTVAWNNVIEPGAGIKGLDKLIKTSTEPLLARCRAVAPNVEHLRRVTVLVHEPGDAQCLTGALRNLHGFDLIAVMPTSERAMAQVCEAASIDVDIMCLDHCLRMGFLPTTKQVEAVARRGLVLEVGYSPIILLQGQEARASSSRRQQLLANLAQLATVVRARGVLPLVVGSGGHLASHLRGPHDVANLIMGVMPGLRLEQALASLSGNGCKAIEHGKARRLGWVPVEVQISTTSSSIMRPSDHAASPCLPSPMEEEESPNKAAQGPGDRDRKRSEGVGSSLGVPGCQPSRVDERSNKGRRRRRQRATGWKGNTVVSDGEGSSGDEEGEADTAEPPNAFISLGRF